MNRCLVLTVSFGSEVCNVKDTRSTSKGTTDVYVRLMRNCFSSSFPGNSTFLCVGGGSAFSVDVVGWSY